MCKMGWSFLLVFSWILAKISNGLILQWRLGVLANGQQATPIYFPIAFPHYVLAITTNAGSWNYQNLELPISNMNNVLLGNYAVNGFYAASYNTQNGFDFMAVGY